VAGGEIDLLLPMTDVTTPLLLTHRAALSPARLPFVPFETYDRVSDKWQLYQLARALNLPVPATHDVKTADDAVALRRTLPFPWVIKPYRSRIASAEGGVVTAPVTYVFSENDLANAVRNPVVFCGHTLLIQQYIAGEGQGLFALYNAGTPVAFFAHRRLREKPPTGGVSVLSESVAVVPRLREIAETLLTAVHWHGVAMVEFKVTANGTPYLIEVNARFWGSLQLAVDAGVDFPWMLYRVAFGEPVAPVDAYRVGIRNRWLMGDLDNLYLQWKTQRFPSGSWRRAITEFLAGGARYEVNRWDDLAPFWFELKSYFSGGPQ